MKIIINTCYGGFALSKAAVEELKRLADQSNDYALISKAGQLKNIRHLRNHGHLVTVVEELGEKANGPAAQLKVIEIPGRATDWEIDDYDGAETVRYVVGGKLFHA